MIRHGPDMNPIELIVESVDRYGDEIITWPEIYSQSREMELFQGVRMDQFAHLRIYA